MRLHRPRAYSPVEARQQRADRLVSSRDELLRMLEEAAQDGVALHVRLATDIELPAGITLPAEVPALHVNGGNLHGFIYTADLPYVWNVEAAAGHLAIRDTTFRGARGHTATVFVTTTIQANAVRLEGLEILNTPDLFDPARNFDFGHVLDVAFNDDVAAATADIRGGIVACTFLNVRGQFNFTPTGDAGGNTLVAVNANGTYDTASGGGGNVAVGVGFSTAVLHVTDSYVGTAAGVLGVTHTPALALGPNPMGVSGIDPTLNPNMTTMRIDASGASGNLSISDGTFDGQQLRIRVAVAGPLTLPNSTLNNVRLSAAWSAGLHDSISLEWDATDGNWIETGRTNIP